MSTPDHLGDRPRGGSLIGRDDYLERWARLHGGYRPEAGSRLVRRWLGVVYLAARPLAAAGARPAAVTAGGVLLAGLAVLPAAAGGRWPLLAVGLVLASGVADSLDGAVAVLTGRDSPSGYVLDSVADRLGEVACLAALWAVGAPAWLAVSAAGSAWLLEYTRARAGNAGFGEIGVVTVGERPTRIIAAVFGLLGAGAAPGLAVLSGTVGAAVTLAATLVGFVQFALVARRELAAGQGQPGRPAGRG